MEKIITVGPDVQNTIIAIDHNDALGDSLVKMAGYKSGPKLMSTLIPRPLKRAITFEALSTPEKIRSFIECRKYQNSESKEKSDSWRISKKAYRTKVDYRDELRIDGSPPEILVIDAPSGSEKTAYVWSTTKKRTSGWVIVQSDSPEYIDSNLYHSLYNCYENRHIIIISADTVRKIRRSPLISSLSWESVAEGIRDAFIPCNMQNLGINDGSDVDEIGLAFRGKFKTLGDKLPYSLIVPISNDGAVYINLDPTDPKALLIYDPQSIEGEWAKLRQGEMVNGINCVTAAVAAGALENFATKPIEDYIAAGLEGGRGLHEEGFNLDGGPCFPVKLTAQKIKDSIGGVVSFKNIKIPIIDEVNWSIVKEEFLQNGTTPIKNWAEIRERIFAIVKSGIDHEKTIPTVQFDKLTAALREEIEGLRMVSALMREYSDREKNKRPLSLAVFGYPGSGKSFAIKSVAKSVLHTRREFSTLEFNLSQFSEPKQLYQALHQVRDLSLSGFMPLVFWDEFDCDFNGDYGWLRYFLAPMQDGKFTQGQLTHSIGDAVFVFAGGTSMDMQSFRKSAENATTAKGPDFLSRLHGFLDVPGLDHSDILLAGVLIRRALLLRSLLKYYAPEIDGAELDIDESVLTAFLCTSKFQYGARSMEAILMMSNLKGKTRFETSSLPSLHQIGLHVDSSDWILALEERNRLIVGDKRAPRTTGVAEEPSISW